MTKQKQPVDPRIQALYDHTRLANKLLMEFWSKAYPDSALAKLFGPPKPPSRWKRITYPFRVAKCRLATAWDALRGRNEDWY